METKTVAKLQLGQEEILYLISLFKVGTLLGLGKNPLEQFPENERHVVLRAGFNSLQARGLLNYNLETKTVELDTLLLALFNTCANSQYMVFVGRTPVDAMPDVTYFYKKEQLVVSHELPSSNIHAFTAYFDPISVKDAISAKLGLNDNTKATDLACELESSKFNELLKLLVEEKIAEAHALGQTAGLDVVSTNLLIDLLQSMHANSTVVSASFDENRAISQGELYAWIEGDSGAIRVETIERAGDEFVHLSPFFVQELRERIPVWFHVE